MKTAYCWRLSLLVVEGLIFLTLQTPNVVAFSTLALSRRFSGTTFVGRSRDPLSTVRRPLKQAPVIARSPSQSSTSLCMTVNYIEKSYTIILNGVLKFLSLCTVAMLSILREVQHMTRGQKLVTLSLFTAGFLLGRTKPFWKRYESVRDIPTGYFGPTAPILTGRAVSVSDGDTIRFLHTPLATSRKKIQKSEKVSETALPIRICTIDTPETPKFGKPGQVSSFDILMSRKTTFSCST